MAERKTELKHKFLKFRQNVKGNFLKNFQFFIKLSLVYCLEIISSICSFYYKSDMAFSLLRVVGSCQYMN